MMATREHLDNPFHPLLSETPQPPASLNSHFDRCVRTIDFTRRLAPAFAHRIARNNVRKVMEEKNP